MYRPRTVLTKVISRYLSPEPFASFIKELSSYKRVTDPMFVNILKKHFDIEIWKTSPIIKQDLWLYNYLVYEYEKKLKCSGMMFKYTASCFIYQDLQFYAQVEILNQRKVRLPRGVKFIPHNGPVAQPANHKLAKNLAPGLSNGKWPDQRKITV